ncbi:MAG: hypothetical protein GKR94_25235 [Gammaproteobacteria bacterium]|nr:hypothetical protein [Gammaproteobacteria bacterium]
MSQVVAGKPVIVTRPAGPGRELCDALAAEGIHAVLLPALGTRPLPVASAGAPKEADAVVFVSPTAVRYGLKWLAQLSCDNYIAVGERTGLTLAGSGVTARYPSTGATSEDVLQMPELRALGAGNKVVIVRGRGGREFLACALRRAGVSVDYIEVYERYCPCPDTGEVSRIRQLGAAAVLLLTSVEGIANLARILEVQELCWLQANAELVVLSQRLLTAARQAGFTGSGVVSAAQPGELLKALIKTARGR